MTHVTTAAVTLFTIFDGSTTLDKINDCHICRSGSKAGTKDKLTVILDPVSVALIHLSIPVMKPSKLAESAADRKTEEPDSKLDTQSESEGLVPENPEKDDNFVCLAVPENPEKDDDNLVHLVSLFESNRWVEEYAKKDDDDLDSLADL